MDISSSIKPLIFLLLGSLLISCGSEELPTESDGDLALIPVPAFPPINGAEIQTGYLLDSAVQGVNYMTSDGTQSKTNADGAFNYFSGDLIEFSIGDIVIGSFQTIPSPPHTLFIGDSGVRVTPLTLMPNAENSDDPGVINLLIFLQTLDDDGNPDNGIHITDRIHLAAKDKTMDFTLAVNDFINGEFSDFVQTLNLKEAFSAQSPREIRSEIAALRHFGDLNSYPLNIDRPKTTFRSWWNETDGCLDIGESLITVKSKSILFCPNITGRDGCYEGVVRDNGDIHLPVMQKNSYCKWLEPGTEWYIANCEGAEFKELQANLKFIDGVLSGSYEASCNIASNNSPQLLTAKFIEIKSESSFLGGSVFQAYKVLENTINKIDSIIQAGHCSIDADCKTLTLAGSQYCSLPIYKAYAPDSVDMSELLLNKHIYTELKDEQEYTPGTGSTICYIPRAPSAGCVDNFCRLQDEKIFVTR